RTSPRRSRSRGNEEAGLTLRFRRCGTSIWGSHSRLPGSRLPPSPRRTPTHMRTSQMRSTLVRGSLAIALVAAPLALAVSPTSASPVQTGAEHAASAKPYVLKDGESSPVYSYKNAIRESVWVHAPDGDGDGKQDLVTVD